MFPGADCSSPSPKYRQRQRFSKVFDFCGKKIIIKIQWQAQEKGSEQASLELLLFRSGISLLAALSLSNSKGLGDSLPNEQSLPEVSTLRTIFLFSLFCEPLLCKFLIFIFVPLSAEVQVLSLRRRQSVLTLLYSLTSSEGRLGKEVEPLGLCGCSSRLGALRYIPVSSVFLSRN